MPFDPFKKRIVPPVMTLEERVAREKGIYPDSGTGWNIPFQIFYSGKSLSGYLIANHVRHINGLPGTFLVYWDLRFRGVINWTSDGWTLERTDSDLVYALGEWITIYYQ
jgi:hypothetical protein